jgi:diguanylate cyclase (GGDEF)-like protein
MMKQRSQELKVMHERLELQAVLLAEQVSSKLNAYEMVVDLIHLRASTLDLTQVEDQQILSLMVRQQLFLHDEIEGTCLLAPNGTKLYSSFYQDFVELEHIRSAMLVTHTEQNIPFSLFSFIHEGKKHLVLSRSLFDRSNQVQAIVALVIETERFFAQLSQISTPGIIEGVLYDADGVLYGAWAQDRSSVQEFSKISDMPGYNRFVEITGDESELFGGQRLVSDGNDVFYLVQTAHVPMMLGLRMHIPSAMASFDRTLLISAITIILLMIATLIVYHLLVRQTREKDQLQQQMLEELSVQVQQRTQELEHLSSYDGLTGLINRRKLSQQLETAVQGNTSFSVACIDLDGFKQVNDSKGHVIGDQVLIHIAQVIADATASDGVVGRWGGDELMLLIPDASAQKAAAISDRIRKAVEQHPYDEDLPCTISVGIAEYTPPEALVSVIRRADSALYRAKAEGKNCVRVAEPEGLTW